MDDLISRQAIDILVDELARAISDERCCMSRGRSTATIMQDILDLPSVNPQEPKWIPVSERLPEEKMAVLVWCPEYKNIYCAYLEKKQWWIFGAFVQIVPNEVVAWMPLPPCYEPQEGSKE